MAIVNEYTILVFLDVRLVTFFLRNHNAGEASKYPKVANILLFIVSHFLQNDLISLVLYW